MTSKYKHVYISPNEASTEPRAKRSLGQNFLQDANIARKIVGLLAVTPADSVLEIGPGPGALSGIIQARNPARLVLLEKDSHWAGERLREGRRQGGNISVILTDALTMTWERLVAPWKIIGNLPYNIASPLMWDIFSRSPGLTRAVFMIQKEVGQRITAMSGSSHYGALSVWVQSFMRARLEFVVPPQVFRPRPKVDSAVLSFEPLREAAFSSGGTGAGGFVPDALGRTLKMCFQMRRKQLGTILRANGCDASRLEPLGIAPEARPETLTPEDFHRLSCALYAVQNN